MRLSLFIARKYFFSTKKKTFINFLSIISMLAVAIGTMTLIIVLSVFNGLEGLIRSLYTTFDPEIKITAQVGKSFHLNDELLQQIEQVEGVNLVTEVIEDNAVVKFDDNQMVVTLKGVSNNFIDQGRLDDAIVYGDLVLQKANAPYALIGRGVQYALSLAVSKDENYFLQIFYPRNTKIANINPNRLTKRRTVKLGGIFAIEKQYDENYIFVPIDFAEDLMDYNNRRTSLEIKIDEGASEIAVQAGLKSILGSDFEVLNSDEQHRELYKLLRIEKLFVFITFTFILAVASFNIFFSLSMLAIDKKKDIAVLFSFGATRRLVRSIFLTEGAIIAFSGAIIGLLLGLMVCLVQQNFGVISMGMETSILEAYPVELRATDFIYTSLCIVHYHFFGLV